MSDLLDGLLPNQRQAAPLVITGAHVVPMTDNRILERHSIRLEAGRITHVGPDGGVPADGAAVVPADGRFVVPGLADMHTHVMHPDHLLLYLANGVTTLRHMWGSPAHLAYEARREAGELALPRLRPQSPIIDGDWRDGRPTHAGSTLITDPSAASGLVRRYAERGYRMLKLYSSLHPEVVAALGSAARDAGVELGGHCPDGMSQQAAIEAGFRCFEHLLMVERGHCRHEDPADVGSHYSEATFRRISDGIDLDLVRRHAARLAEQQVWNVPTLVVVQRLGHGVAGAPDEPAFEHMSAFYRTFWTMATPVLLVDHRSGDTSEPARWLEAHARYMATLQQVVKVLHEEGAPLMVGTDAPNPFVTPGFAIHDELALFVGAGLTPYEALRCATVEPARFLGEKFGTIQPGFAADLVMVDGNPLEDIGALRRIAGVVSAGVHLSAADLDCLLGAQVARVAEPLAAPPLLGGGHLQGTFGALHTADVAYRHEVMADQLVEVTEHAATRQGVIVARLSLRPEDGEIVAADVVVTSPFGTTSTLAARGGTDPRTMAVTLSGDDGFQSQLVFDRPLHPHPELAATALLQVLATPGHRRLLSFDPGETAASVTDAQASSGATPTLDISGDVWKLEGTDPLVIEQASPSMARRLAPPASS